MSRKVLMEGLPTNITDLEEPCTICPLTKAIKVTRVPNIDVSKISPGFMLQMDFAFFDVESISGFTSNFVAICSATSHTFVFPSRRKRPSLETLKFLVTTLSNQDKKNSFIRVDKYRALARYSEFMGTCNNMNIIV